MGDGTQSNAKRLLWAGFTAIAAAGVGFSIRGGILGDWGDQFGFTKTQLGAITGGGLTGFGIVILLGSFLADRLGYGTLMVAAFLFHLASAVLTLAATPAFEWGGQDAAYFCLFWGMFLFAIGNGIAEAVVNPLVATLFPDNKTHYLNILHAGWPAGLVAGGLASFFMAGKVSWEIQIALFLVPTVLYGLMLFGQRFPKSEASQKGVAYLEMLKELGMLGAAVICALFALFFANDVVPMVMGIFKVEISGTTANIIGVVMAVIVFLAFSFVTKFSLGPILLAFLLVIHAMVGYVELGTDSWISNITGTIMASPARGLLLFVYTSTLMFVLRFFAGPIVHKISPLGLLFVSALFGVAGLFLLGGATSVVLCVLAATIYGIGKTYFWPTMLGVVSERFPKGGAITIGAIGGVGMLSAGLLGGPGIGYKQDYFASKYLENKDAALYAEYKSEDKSSFLIFPEIQGLDGQKVGGLKSKAEAVAAAEAGNPLTDEQIEALQYDPNAVPTKETSDESGSDDAATNEDSDTTTETDEAATDEADTAASGDDSSAADEGESAAAPVALSEKESAVLTKLKEASSGDEPKGVELSEEEVASIDLAPSEKLVLEADLTGGRNALKATSLVPATMAICYLLLIFYFATQGGYKTVHIGKDDK